MRWDIFCRVIDNHGDLGVCWRLAAELAARGDGVRLWVDDVSGLAWMAPAGRPGVQVLPWQSDADGDVEPGDVAVEAFGCEPPAAYLARLATATRERGTQPPWINLEYLSAEPYVERSHGLPSPLFAGPAAGLVRHFFYPGFTASTGGLLREQDLAARQAAFDASAWLQSQGLDAGPALRLSLFCYEPAALPGLLQQLAAGGAPVRMLVSSGRATAAARSALDTLDATRAGWNAAGQLAIDWLPLLDQPGFDRLLWACDLNLVRGEDSLVRALWAGKPLLWQLYPQDDGAHMAKLEAFLRWLAPPASLAAWMRAWNGAAPAPATLPVAEWRQWRASLPAAWPAVPELAARLRQFAAVRGRI